MIPEQLQTWITSIVSQFSEYFTEMKNKYGGKKGSILASLTKEDKAKFDLILKRLLHIYRTSINLKFMKNNIGSNEYIDKVLQIVQVIIEDEERVA